MTSLWVINENSGIQVYSLPTLGPNQSTISLDTVTPIPNTVGYENLQYDGTNIYAVTAGDNTSIAVIDPTSHTITDTIDLGSNNEITALDYDDTNLYAAVNLAIFPLKPSQICVIDKTSRVIITRITPTPNLSNLVDLTVSGGTIYVTGYGSETSNSPQLLISIDSNDPQKTTSTVISQGAGVAANDTTVILSSPALLILNTTLYPISSVPPSPLATAFSGNFDFITNTDSSVN